jgi:hypothetical protein
VRKIIGLFFLTLAGSLVAIESDEFFSVVDFEASIESIAEMVSDGRAREIDTERFFVLEGAVGSVQVFNPDPAAYQAVIELVSASWEELASIDVSRVLILVDSAELGEMIAESPRNAAPEQIETNETIIAVGSFVGLFEWTPTEELAVIRAVALR